MKQFNIVEPTYESPEEFFKDILLTSEFNGHNDNPLYLDMILFDRDMILTVTIKKNTNRVGIIPYEPTDNEKEKIKNDRIRYLNENPTITNKLDPALIHYITH